MFEFLNYPFFYSSIIISVILSFLFTLISFIVITKKVSFLAIGTEHAAFGGVGIAQLLQTDVFVTTLVFCTSLTVFAGKTSKKNATIGIEVLFAGAMAMGMMLLSINDGAKFNLMSFLFGDILGIGFNDILLALLITVISYIIIIPNINKVLFIIFDNEMAQVSGIKIDMWDTIIYILLSVSIVLGINLVGVLLIAGLTVLPASFALMFQKNVTVTMVISFLYTLLIMVGGVLLSFFLDIAPGSLIVLLGVLIYFIFNYKIKRTN